MARREMELSERRSVAHSRLLHAEQRESRGVAEDVTHVMSPRCRELGAALEDLLLRLCEVIERETIRISVSRKISVIVEI